MIGHKARDGAIPLCDGKMRQIEVPMPEGNPELGDSEVAACALRQLHNPPNDPTRRRDPSVTHPLRLPLLGMRASFEVLDLDGSVGRILQAVCAQLLQTFD